MRLLYFWVKLLKKKAFCFMKVIIKDDIQEIAKELKIFNSKKEKKRYNILQKKKRDT